jgi:DNA-binding response OmpR family regulator
MPATILLVEDHADIRRLVRMTLEFEPCQILEAADAEEGWALATRQRPDLILLDVMMPGRRNGLDLCRDLKAEPTLRDVPVVMLSARGTAADLEAGRQAGASAYLVKPFSPMALLDRVGQLLGLAASQD